MPTPTDSRPSLDWMQLLARYGLGTLLALFLVYQLAGDWNTTLHAIAATLEHHMGDSATQAATQIVLMRLICEHTATTDAERIACREVGR